ncbi:hypothetical protein SAMN05444748_10815 [Variovorax sp. OV700]|nr:hypothetical protein SAMN05444748_10815 [Variovorax sp. OV700]
MRWGLWRGIGVIRFDSSSCWPCLLPEAGISARRRTYFLLLRQKKVSKEKATLLSASLRCATGNLRCSTPAGVRRTRFAQTAAALIPPASALLGAYRRGGSGQPSLSLGPKTNSQCQPPRRAAPRGPGGRAKQRPVWFARPSVCAEERRVSRIRARSCLSEASSARPRETRAPQVARSEAEGRRQWGRPPGRVPASELKQPTTANKLPTKISLRNHP